MLCQGTLIGTIDDAGKETKLLFLTICYNNELRD